MIPARILLCNLPYSWAATRLCMLHRFDSKFKYLCWGWLSRAHLRLILLSCLNQTCNSTTGINPQTSLLYPTFKDIPWMSVRCQLRSHFLSVAPIGLLDHWSNTGPPGSKISIHGIICHHYSTQWWSPRAGLPCFFRARFARLYECV